MNLLKLASILYIPIFIGFSCKKPVKDKHLPEPVERLVVAGFISPEDSLVRVKVSKSIPANGTIEDLTPVIEDASVMISGNGQTAELNYNSDLEIYFVPTATFPVIPGETYVLSVSSPDGMTAKGKTTVPERINTSLTCTVDSITRTHSFGGNTRSLIFTVEWTDPAGQPDYYRISGRVNEISASPDTMYVSPDSSYISVTPTGPRDLYFDTDYSTSVIEDRSSGEQKMGPYTAEYGLPPDPEELRARIYLLTIDSNYYNYCESLSTVYTGNPFTEPENLYTSIEGGFGVFASYRMYSLEKEVD